MMLRMVLYWSVVMQEIMKEMEMIKLLWCRERKRRRKGGRREERKKEGGEEKGGRRGRRREEERGVDVKVTG